MNRILPSARRVAALVAVLVPALGVTLCTRASAAPPTVEAFAATMDYSAPALSPDGGKIAYVGRAGGKRVVFVLDLVRKTRLQVSEARFPMFEITRCTFKNDERLVCGLHGTDFFHGQAYPVSRLIALDLTGKDKPKVLIQKTDLAFSQFQDKVIDWLPDNPRNLLIELTDGSVYPGVYVLDVYSGLLKPLQPRREPILSWFTDHGVVRLGAGFDDRGGEYIIRDADRAPWQVLGKWKVGEADFSVVGFGATTRTVLISDFHNGRRAIFEKNLDDSADRQLLFSHPQVDVGEPIIWPVDQRIVGFEYEAERSQRMLFDADAELAYGIVDASLPDSINSVIGSSRTGTRLLISSSVDVRPTHYFILDLEKKQLQRVGSRNPELDGMAHAEMKPVQMKGLDGVMIPGYLSVPPGSSGKQLPLVVFPHGGPHSRDSWGFDSMVQFMASRGYAVLQVNFRGSTGYGADWYEAGFRNWGTVMIDDVTAATRWALETGVADPARVCVVGWSYGGYAALMSAVRESGLYRCVASIAGVADLSSLAREASRFHGGRVSVQDVLGTDSDALKAGSPLRSAASFKVPVLLVHGEDDTTVAVDHSERMARMLAQANKKHELMIIKDGDHSLRRFEWRQQLMIKLEEFLNGNLTASRPSP